MYHQQESNQSTKYSMDLDAPFKDFLPRARESIEKKIWEFELVVLFCSYFVFTILSIWMFNKQIYYLRLIKVNIS